MTPLITLTAPEMTSYFPRVRANENWEKEDSIRNVRRQDQEKNRPAHAVQPGRF